MDKQKLLDILSTVGATVEFLKEAPPHDHRRMVATRNYVDIPTQQWPAQSIFPTAQPKVDNIRVFDIEKAQWRSFNFHRVMSYTTNLIPTT